MLLCGSRSKMRLKVGPLPSYDSKKRAVTYCTSGIPGYLLYRLIIVVMMLEFPTRDHTVDTDKSFYYYYCCDDETRKHPPTNKKITEK